MSTEVDIRGWVRLSSKVVDIQGVTAVKCSSRRQKLPRQNDSQIVKYKKNIQQ